MKLQRIFTTTEPDSITRGKASQYMTQTGYKPVEGSAGLTFERGSQLGTMFSNKTAKWHTQTTIQVRPEIDGLTHVVATYDINTTGQLIIERERQKWAQELDGLVAACGGAVDLNAPPSIQAQVEAKMRVETTLRSGANWFYWIAAMSVINSIIVAVGGGWSFIVGLGVTQLVDGIAIGVSDRMSSSGATFVHVMGFGIDAVFALIFFMFGFFARKSRRWAFIIGMVLYALDGAIFLWVQDWLSIAFHVWALWGLYNGLKAVGRLQKLETSAAPLPA